MTSWIRYEQMWIGVLADLAKARINIQGYNNIEVHVGDGTLGWPEIAPFNAILVTAGGASDSRFLNQPIEQNILANGVR